jgi:hypothetical protein
MSSNVCSSINKYSTYLIAPAGLILNTICVPIFYKIIKSEPANIQSNLFRFYLSKSVCDLIYPILVLLKLPHNSECYDYYILQLLSLFNEFLIGFVMLLSVLFEILASIDCLLMISRKFQQLRTTFCFKITMIISIISISLAYMPFLFYSKINVIEDYSSNLTVHYQYNLTTHNLKVYRFHLSFLASLRDGSSILISIFFNILIIIFLHKTFKRKLKVQSEKHRTSVRINTQRAELNKVKMVIFTSLVYLLHLPSFFRYIFNLKVGTCFYSMSLMCIRISYAIPFFSYFLFNNNFRKFFLKIYFQTSVDTTNTVSPILPH